MPDMTWHRLMHSKTRGKRMAPSFVVTLVGAGSLVLACQGKTQPETISPEPTPKAKPTTAEPSATATQAQR